MLIDDVLALSNVKRVDNRTLRLNVVFSRIENVWWQSHCFCEVKPGTHWRQSWIQHGGLCWKSTVGETGNNRQQSRLLPIWSTLLPVLATNRQQLEFDSLSRWTLLPVQSTFLPIQSTFNKVDCVEFNFVASVYLALDFNEVSNNSSGS